MGDKMKKLALIFGIISMPSVLLGANLENKADSASSHEDSGPRIPTASVNMAQTAISTTHSRLIASTEQSPTQQTPSDIAQSGQSSVITPLRVAIQSNPSPLTIALRGARESNPKPSATSSATSPSVCGPKNTSYFTDFVAQTAGPNQQLTSVTQNIPNLWADAWRMVQQSNPNPSVAPDPQPLFITQSQSEETYNQRYYKRHKDQLRAKARARRLANPEKRKAYYQRYYEKHRDQINAKKKARRLANPEKGRAQRRAYRLANPEKVRAQEKAHNQRYREEHRDQINAKKRAYHLANKEKVRAQRRAYRLANLEKVRAQERARRLANKEKRKAQAMTSKQTAKKVPAKASHKPYYKNSLTKSNNIGTANNQISLLYDPFLLNEGQESTSGDAGESNFIGANDQISLSYDDIFLSLSDDPFLLNEGSEPTDGDAGESNFIGANDQISLSYDDMFLSLSDDPFLLNEGVRAD